MRKLLISLIFLSVSLLSFSQKLAVYFPYYRSSQQVDAIQYDKVTDVIYAFAKPTASGGSEILGPAIFDALRIKCDQNSVPFHLAMGGYGLSDNFRVIAADANLRNTFAQHCASLCTQYGLAGIDIDWEFPSPSEVDNVNLMLEALQSALAAISTPQNPIALSVTVGGEQGHANYFKAGFSDYVDYVSIMAYDAPVGTWGHHSSMDFMKSAINVWEGMGVPTSKMLVGVPFYGRCAGEASYADISVSNPATAFMSDTYNGYCYNGKPTLIAKTDTAMNMGCAGMMVWEVSHDRSDQYSLLSVMDGALEKFDCAIPELLMDEVYTNCNTASTTFMSNAPESSGRVFNWYANGNLLYSGSENSYTTNAVGNFELIVEEDGCLKTVSFIVNQTMDLSALPPSIILCNPGIDTIFSPYIFNEGYKTLWEYNGNLVAENVDFLEVLQAGVYKLSVMSSICPMVEKNIQVTHSGLLVGSQTNCEGKVLELFAGAGDIDLQWFYGKNDNQAFFQGDTLYHVLSESDTLYYEEKSTLESHKFTEIESGFNQNSSFYGTKFSVWSSAHLSSFELSTIAGGTVGVSVLNENLATVFSTSITAVNGKNVVSVDWDFTEGTYFLICSEAPAGQLKLFSTYSASEIVKGNVTLHSGVYNSFSAPAYDGKSEYFGFFREITFESGSNPACGRKAVVLTAEECNNCVQGDFSLNNILFTYGDPAVKVKPNYQGVNDLYFYSHGGVVSFTNDFARPLKVGSASYFVAEICDGDTIQIVSAQILVQKANLTIISVNDTIRHNDALPANITIKYSGFKSGDNENDLLQLPQFVQTTDGTVVGEFDYIKTQDAKAGNYNLAYDIGKLVVTSTVGINKTLANSNYLLHTSNGKKLRINKASYIIAYATNGKMLWQKSFEKGEYFVDNEVFVLVDSKGEILK
jgi:GH18 family chitinase